MVNVTGSVFTQRLADFQQCGIASLYVHTTTTLHHNALSLNHSHPTTTQASLYVHTTTHPTPQCAILKPRTPNYNTSFSLRSHHDNPTPQCAILKPLTPNYNFKLLSTFTPRHTLHHNTLSLNHSHPTTTQASLYVHTTTHPTPQCAILKPLTPNYNTSFSLRSHHDNPTPQCAILKPLTPNYNTSFSLRSHHDNPTPQCAILKPLTPNYNTSFSLRSHHDTPYTTMRYP
ncbi:hypothetical protein BaRGS_00024270 [Batillaria attramentaria]|uniref:Uncharacterized protein n=1 Tax=Batillaria attramentaria TaxID=370345 RepID=A0ABD0KBQ2_9CAEN